MNVVEVNQRVGPDVEYHIVNISQKLDALKSEFDGTSIDTIIMPLAHEIRSIEFWKSVLTECLASFIYVFIVYGAGASVGGGSLAVLSSALSSGLAMMFLTQCFFHISGAHINPAISFAMGITKNISLLRCCSFIAAQCGGAIAGAAFSYGVIEINYQKNVMNVNHVDMSEKVVDRFGVELVMTFVVAFCYFEYVEGRKKVMGNSAVIIGTAHSACTLVSIPHLNPARSLGASFIMNKWKNHWIYWVGPIAGGVLAALVHRFAYRGKENKSIGDISDDDSLSVGSEDATYDDVEKPPVPKHHGSMYNTYRPATSTAGQSGVSKEPSVYGLNGGLYSTAPTKLERVESLYGGTKSLYCKSPQLTRANLNRSQSLYSRSNGNQTREAIPKPGHLVPAQSLHSIKMSQQNHAQNQNLHNQLQHRSESVYGMRNCVPPRPDPYGTSAEWSYGRTTQHSNDNGECKEGNTYKLGKSNRPDSLYGILDGRSPYNDSNCAPYAGLSKKPSNNYSSSNLHKLGQNSAFRAVRNNNTENRSLPSPSAKLLSPGSNNNSY